MKLENLSKKELINKVINLEEKLQNKKTRNKRETIKTTKKEIVEYWEERKDESDYSFDFAETEYVCWRCGCERKLQRCHIIPDSLEGKDEPSNFVLLCSRCHIEAPNIQSKDIMWDWLKANKTPFYNTYHQKEAFKEYKAIYNKSFRDELEERDIRSIRDYELFYNFSTVRTSTHFAHPWENDSTMAGVLRMKLEAFDMRHKKIIKKSEKYRRKEKIFELTVWYLCQIARKYNFNVWEGRSKNPFSIVLSGRTAQNNKLRISIKLKKNCEFFGCYTDEWNPNNIKAKEYNIYLGKDRNMVEEFVKSEMKKFCDKYGKPEKQEYVFTIDPSLHKKENT